MLVESGVEVYIFVYLTVEFEQSLTVRESTRIYTFSFAEVLKFFAALRVGAVYPLEC